MGFILSNPVTIDRASTDVIFFTSLETTGPKPWLSLSVIFLAVAVIMAGPGEIVGSCFHHLPRLEAYRLDLIGSLMGIGAFTLLSFTGAPSVVWGAIVATLYAVLLGRPGRGLAIAAGRRACHAVGRRDVHRAGNNAGVGVLVPLLQGDDVRPG